MGSPLEEITNVTHRHQTVRLKTNAKIRPKVKIKHSLVMRYFKRADKGVMRYCVQFENHAIEIALIRVYVTTYILIITKRIVA